MLYNLFKKKVAALELRVFLWKCSSNPKTGLALRMSGIKVQDESSEVAGNVDSEENGGSRRHHHVAVVGVSHLT
ncbi:hypothetical protein RJT34_20073 [Clitoria ternatea]|uniref:Uncharacterized protein n=1 Tax=Clitoria ternatea TaxID=43366 RepID=A0AAN9P5C7_CLITE